MNMEIKVGQRACLICVAMLLLVGALLCVLTYQSESKDFTSYRLREDYYVTESFQSEAYAGNLTLDVFMKLHEYPSSWTPVIEKNAADHRCEFSLRISNRERGQWYYGSSEKTTVLEFETKRLFPLNQWIRITAIRDHDASWLKVFVNGREKARLAIDSRASSAMSPIQIGGNGTYNLQGSIAEVRIWSSALTEEELFRNAITIDPSDPTLVNHWRFQDTGEVELRDAISGSDDNLFRGLTLKAMGHP